jgi:PIN domain nuclease of toxin-antitoxin system
MARPGAVLLDSHTFLWFDFNPSELSTEHANGKLPEAKGLLHDFHGTLGRYGFLELGFTISDAIRAAGLLGGHKDPFDRGLSAQSLERGLSLVSTDASLELFGVTRVW